MAGLFLLGRNVGFIQQHAHLVGLLWRSQGRDEWFYKGRNCSVPNAVLAKVKGATGKGKPPFLALLGPREQQAHRRSILPLVYSDTGVLSPRGSQKTSCRRHKVCKVQIKVILPHVGYLQGKRCLCLPS